MAVTKIHPIKSTLNLAIKYITNKDKTNEKILVSTFLCNEDSAHLQFEKTRNHYDKKPKVLARHLIQSFYPGEVTPELAHEIGMKLCTEHLQDKYEFVLTTHVDRGHIHNHILFNNVSYDDGKCYQSNKRSYHQIRAISDNLCKENNLIVIDEYYNKFKKKYRTNGKSWYENNQSSKGNSWKSRLQNDIDKAIRQAKDYEEFIELMLKLGYEFKEGKHLSFKHKDKERFTRTKTIGEDYTKENILKRIETEKEFKVKSPKKPLNRVIDISKSEKAKNSPGYSFWATRHNLRTMASSLSTLRKMGINSRKELEDTIKKGYEKRQELLDKMKVLDEQTTHLASMMEAAHTVNQYKKLYTAYKKDPHNEIFKEDYGNEIRMYEKALKSLKNNFDKMPDTKILYQEIKSLQAQKQALYDEYTQLNEDSKVLMTIKNNYDTYMKKDLER